MAVSAKDSHMKILFYRYNSICEPDVIQAFKELGHSVCEIREEMTNKAVTPSECVRLVSNALEKTNSDIVFSINFYPAISEVCNIYHLPYVCWIVDSPVMEQTDYYLRHENERKEIAHNAFEKTLEYHTYEKRVELISSLIQTSP